MLVADSAATSRRSARGARSQPATPAAIAVKALPGRLPALYAQYILLSRRFAGRFLIGFEDARPLGGCDLYRERQAVDTTTPAGRALFQMLGVFAEFERSIITERTIAGIARARMCGTKSGKAIGRPKVAPKIENAIRASLTRGVGILKTARELQVGSGTVQGVKAAMQAADR